MSTSLKRSWRVSRQTVTGASCSVFLLLVSGFWILTSLPAPAIVDTNNNTVSDIWEKHFNNGNLLPNLVPQADPDGDGWTNTHEAAAGTNPFDPNPPDGIIRPDIVHIPATYITGASGDPEILTPEAVTLTWPTLPGKQYTLHYSPDLSEGSWQPVEAPYNGNGSITEYGIPLTQENGSTPDKLFWRVAVGDIDTGGDGVTNAEELALGLNPLLADTIPGVPDLWLALNFGENPPNGGLSTVDPNADPDSDGASTLEELQSGTNPVSADASGSRRWITVHGNGAAQEKITRTGTLTIPAGQSALLSVAIASEEFPYWTGVQSGFNDLLEWHVIPSQGDSINGSINVNERHSEWEIDVVDGTTLPGLPSPVHIEQVRGLTAPPDSDLTIQVEVGATNFSDETLPSLVAVGLLPVEIKAYRPEMVQQSVDLRPSDQTKLVIPDAEELNPGVRIRVNRDNDDYDSPYKSDADEDSVSGENDLIKVEFSCPGLAGMTGIKVFLKRSNSKLRTWEAKEKGTAILKNEDEKELTLNAQGAKTIWVEAIDQGEGELEWQLKSGTNVIGTAGKLKFITYKELIVGLSGETFYSGSSNGNGMFSVCQKLYLEGYKVAYYDVNGINTTSGDPASREAGFQIWQCFVRDIGMFGHSHGGGATHDISKKLNDTRSSLGSFGINFTGYMDAIQHDGGTFDPAAETRYPPSSLYHWNYYQRHLSIRSNAVTGAAVNLDVNTTTWGSSLGHTSIDSDPTVQKDLHSAIKTHVAP